MTELLMILTCLGWTLALVLALGWYLSAKYDAHERELVSGLNTLNARLETLEKR